MKIKFLKPLLIFACIFTFLFPIIGETSTLTPANANSAEETIILAASDFQAPSGPTAGSSSIKNILSAMEKDGITSADGFLFCGDYDYDTYWNSAQTTEGVNVLKSSISSVISNDENIVLAQGNHDTAIATSGMSPSGDNDPKSDKYGVFLINEDDYMQFNNNQARIQETAQSLVEYLNEKLAESYTKPIFVVSHLPLHYTGRTTYDGDGKYAHYIFDVLNEAGAKGLNIFFLYGHNHSNGWEDYLGGASVFMTHGDQMLVPQGTKEKADCKNETLNFTSLNAGYVGYYSGTSGIDSTLTMTAFKIVNDSVTVVRYDANGKHDLKREGISSDTAIVNKKTYASPQVVVLQNITDTTPLEDLISIEKIGNKYARIDSPSQLVSGNKYLLISNSNAFALPTVVTKANASGEKRTGLEIESVDNVGWSTFYGEHNGKEWTLISQNGGWLLSNGLKYLKLTATENYGITATLEDTGDVFKISGSGNSFTFSTGDYVLNYNSRGLINGYSDSPAPFILYELKGHLITISDGNATIGDIKAEYAKNGQTVKITAIEKENMDFEKWVIQKGNVSLKNEFSATTEFVMPAEGVTIQAQYTQHIHSFTERFASPEYLKDGTKTIYYTSCVCGLSSKGSADELLFGSFRITDGKNGLWEGSDQENLTFKTNAEDTIISVKINGEPIDSSNYTISNNQTVSLNASYLNSLEDGEYKLRLCYSLGECATSFTVTKKTQDTPPIDSETPTIPENPPVNSETSDSTTSTNSSSSGCSSSLSIAYCNMAVFVVCSSLLGIKKRKSK